MRKIRSIYNGLFALLIAPLFLMPASGAEAATLTGDNVIVLINQSRASEGLLPLETNSKLSQAAAAKANDMFSQQYFAHIGPDGKGPEDWIDSAGYDWTAIAENIAYGYSTAEAVHNAFMSSQGHRENILGDYEHVGVAAVSGQYNGYTTIMVVEEFGSGDTSSGVTTYALTVNGGTGDGNYTAGTRVTISADAPAAGKVFDKWTGGISYVASTTASTTTVTMPSSAISLIANYKDIPTYPLTINSGSGDGTYAAGAKVAISADPPSSGQVFDKWTGDTAYLASTTSSSATVTMPSTAVILTATYKAKPVVTYNLTVTNGSGDGSYAAGAAVNIIANTPIAGKVFDKWTGSIAYIADANAASTTVTMPSSSITLTATYKAMPTYYGLTVNNGSGSGSYVSGTKVSVEAISPDTGKVFDKWTGDTSYVSSISSVAAVVTMPSRAITLSATYREVSTGNYSLSIIGGSGAGYFASGDKVTISADVPTNGKIFEKWTGDTSYLSSVFTSTATVTMPAKGITLVAVYGDASDATYLLTINGGTGGGNYAAGTNVTVKADAPAAGKIFDKWIGSTAYVVSVNSSSAIVTMPSKAITLSATYKTAPVVKYTLTVTSGTGSGTYAAGTNVSITAKSASTGKVFDKWTGDISYVFDPTSASTKVTVPEKNISIVATYREKTSNLTDGTLIRAEASVKIYVIISGKKKWIPTPEVFEQLGYYWTDIKILPKSDLDKYPDYEDNLIRRSGDTSVYLVVNGIRRHIPNPDVFNGYGFDWNDVKDVEQDVVDKYQEAYLIRASKDPNVYYIHNGVRKLIPNMDIFRSYGDRVEDVQIVSMTERDAYPITNLIRLASSVDVYLIEGSVKRRVPSVAVFNQHGFDWARVISINQIEFDYYQTGTDVR